MNSIRLTFLWTIVFVFLVAPWGTSHARLVISEYVEGSGTQKALELWNISGSSIVFGTARGQLNVKVQQYSNGSSAPTATMVLTPGAVVPPGEVYVLVNAPLGSPLAAVADQFSVNATWDGDDALVVLVDESPFIKIMDSLGQVGFDPGTGWGTGLTSTADNTLRRKPSYIGADVVSSDAYHPAVAFDGFSIDTFNHVGIPPVSGPPLVNTLSATVIGASAILNGEINAKALSTTAWFEWGTTTNYGNVTPAQPLGSSLANTNISYVFNGLSFGVTYHFRAVASNSLGTTFGTNLIMGRALEMFLPGQNSSAYIVNASTNLAQWKLMNVFFASNSPARLVDPEVPQFSKRFYRYHTIPAILQELPYLVEDPSHTLFRQPSLSSSTRDFINTSTNSPDFSRLTNSFPGGISATQVIHASWAFTNGAVNPWLRLTTFDTTIFGNPTISFDQGLCFDVYSDRDIYLALGLRETTAGSFGIGDSGGTFGPIEWVGGTLDNSLSPPRGRLITAGQWHRVCFFVPEEPVRAFTGNGILSSINFDGLGVFEHLAIVPVDGTGVFNLYIGKEIKTMPADL